MKADYWITNIGLWQMKQPFKTDILSRARVTKFEKYLQQSKGTSIYLYIKGLSSRKVWQMCCKLPESILILADFY